MRTWLDILGRVRSVETLWHILRERNPAFESLRRIAILGSAREGKNLARICQSKNIDVASIADEKIGNGIHDFDSLNRDIPVIIASHRTLLATKALKGLGFKNVAPLALLQVLYPEQYPPHPFYDGLLADLYDNLISYEKLYESLSDDVSRETLDTLIGYRMTLDPEVLAPVIDWELYYPRNLLDFTEEEIYVDAGAFTGDSVSTFIKRVNDKFRIIYAFEPDKDSFNKLSMWFADDPRFRLVNAGLHSGAGNFNFETGGRGSRFKDGEGKVAPVVRLDAVLSGAKVTFIKMNIEGCELEALEGARQTLKRWYPRLAISAYHRPSDLWEVPKKILDIDPHYKLYLRQHDGGIVETVCYAI